MFSDFGREVTKNNTKKPSAWTGNRLPRAKVLTQVKSSRQIWA